MQDYANKRQPQPIEKPDNRSWLNILMLVLAFMFTLAGIIHFAEKQDTRPTPLAKPVATIQPEKQTEKLAVSTNHPHQHQHHAAQKKHPVHHPVHHNKTTPATNPQPKYDFYKLLPEMTVNVPAPAKTTAH